MTTTDTSLIGAAGVHFVVSELCMRGLIALPTIKNTAGVDVLVTDSDGEWHANLQVKTSKNRASFWPIGHRYLRLQGARHYYVFVRYLKNEDRFEAFLESGRRVARNATEGLEAAKRRGNKPWAPCWSLPKDPRGQARVRNQWEEFGPRK